MSVEADGATEIRRGTMTVGIDDGLRGNPESANGDLEVDPNAVWQTLKPLRGTHLWRAMSVSVGHRNQKKAKDRDPVRDEMKMADEATLE